jgi:hypothetical protein
MTGHRRGLLGLSRCFKTLAPAFSLSHSYCFFFDDRAGYWQDKDTRRDARKGDTSNIYRMQHDLFDVLAKRSRAELGRLSLMVQGVRKQYMNELRDVGIKDLAIHRRLGKMNTIREMCGLPPVRQIGTGIISGFRRGDRICGAMHPEGSRY